MRHHNSVFHQLTKQIPWDVFDAAVADHGADFRVRRMRTRDQFLAVLFGQLSGAQSLREIEQGLQSHAGLLYHLGARQVSRTTLADGNAKRPSAVYETLFAELVQRAKPGLRRHLRDPLRLLDATRFHLSARSGGWARFSRVYHGAKLHVAFDPHEHLIVEAAVTPDTVNDITPARAMTIEPGATYVFDMAYYSYRWWADLHARGCRFVTRRKSHVRFHTDQPETLPRHEACDGEVLDTRIGYLSKHLRSTGRNPFGAPVREVVVARKGQGPLRLLTNDLHTPAEEIAALYKQRWQVELLFKWLKQNLKIRHFIGTSENAIRTQIFIALIAFMLVRAAYRAQKTVQRLQHFAKLIRLNIIDMTP